MAVVAGLALLGALLVGCVLSGVTQLAAGSAHACALRDDGTVVCWGDDTYGQLGDGDLGSSAGPVEVSGVVGAVSIGVGQFHSCAVMGDGSVRCWGRNDHGQLGDGTTTNRSVPVVVSGLADVISVDGGGLHTCAVRSGGVLWCWGRNSDGQVGDGTVVTPRTTPVAVTGLTGAFEVAGGANHSCARTASKVRCWGRGTTGQLGNGGLVSSSVPVDVVGIGTAATISAHGSHTCAITGAGGVRCWGRNDRGQVGDGTLVTATSAVLVPGMAQIATIGTGATHSCATRTDGVTSCWGAGDSGQLGHGAFTDSWSPVLVQPVEYRAVKVEGGTSFSCALQASGGGVSCWGANDLGQHGLGSTTGPTNQVTGGVVAPPTPPLADHVFIADTVGDEVDAAPGDGVCARAGGGCTFRAAVSESNATASGTVAIDLRVDVTMTSDSYDDTNAFGDYDVLRAVVIVGNEHTVDAATNDRVLDNHGAHVTIRDLVVTGGHTQFGQDGGGIRSWGGSLTLERVVIRGNSTSREGIGEESWRGLGGGLVASSLTMADSIVEGNEASVANGGGVGGGAYVGSGTITRSRIAGNVGVVAGGLYLSGTASVVDSVVEDNRAIGSTIYDSNSESHHFREALGGGIEVEGGSASLTLQRSALIRNKATRGAAMHVKSGAATVVNTTAFQNESSAGNNFSASASGFSSAVPITLRHVTTTGNLGPSVLALHGGSTIVGSALDGFDGTPLCQGAVSSLGVNVARDASCGLTNASDLQNTDPMVGSIDGSADAPPFAPLLPGSPALDKVPVGFDPVCGSGGVDQRSVLRPVGAACDAGAVEGPAVPLPAPMLLTVNDGGTATDVRSGDGVCATAVGTCTLAAAVREANTRTSDDTIALAGIATAASIDVLDDVTISGSGNTITVDGIGIEHLHGWLRLDDVTMTGADGPGLGGAVVTSAHLTVTASTFDDNEAGNVYGGSSHGGAAIAGGFGSTIEVARSLFTGNTTVSNAFGAAIRTSGALVVTDSTFSGNGVTTKPNGTPTQVGPISAPAGSALRRLTIVGENASYLTVTGSLISACSAGYAGAVSGGYNVASPASCLTQIKPTDVTVATSLVGPLAPNGGPTQTHLPVAGSAAIDSIPVGTTDLCDAAAPTDQRGVARPQGSACDRGAVEAG